ncbi:hypothetical protein [Phycicoccus flavus]|uniref:hypothetical protein n=1 Tax=Phycicoccus flavus TaxID=2502783 RepID=UPI000FEB6699|nr:hypothetical protein [Phycicoccus flavus]NHA69546.1 hypothetical protein [Phycicoccus flavus]
MDTIAQIFHVVLVIGAVAVFLAPIVLLVEMAHHDALASGRSWREFPAGGPDDADARRIVGELRALDAATAPRPEPRGRRLPWVSRAR